MKLWAVIHGVVVRALGGLLLLAAVFKGYELLTVPVANRDLWSWRPFLVCQVEFELALGLWLLSGLFAKTAWLAGLVCFFVFSLVTLYKGLLGAGSCGCFGAVHINPWITLMAIDLPAVIALSLFRPQWVWPRRILLRLRFRRRPVQALLRQYVRPWPSLRHLAITAALGSAILAVTTPILAFTKPPMVTAAYEVLTPKTWLGKELPIIEHIDIAEQLRAGTWLLLFYHYDCPDCRAVIPRYERMAQQLRVKGGFPRIALIEVPPYGPLPFWRSSIPAYGRLSDAKRWYVGTPSALLLTGEVVEAVWEKKLPDIRALIAGNRQESDGPVHHTPVSRATLNVRERQRPPGEVQCGLRGG